MYVFKYLLLVITVALAQQTVPHSGNNPTSFIAPSTHQGPLVTQPPAQMSPQPTPSYGSSPVQETMPTPMGTAIPLPTPTP